MTSGARTLETHSNLIASQLAAHRDRLLEPAKHKVLRPFSLREACHYIGVNQNSLRHTLRSHPELPQGTLVNGTRRFFQVSEIHEIRDFLIETDRIDARNITRRQDGEHTAIIPCINLKGGVGKSTVCQAASHSLALRGYRVLAIDLDAQASLTQLFGIIPEREPDMKSIYHAIRYPRGDMGPVPIHDVIRQTHIPGLDLIPSNMFIMEFEHETAAHDQSENPFFLRIEAALDAVKDDYDVILFDCPPQMSFTVMAALFSATALLVMVTASFVDVMSLGTFLGMTSEMMDVLEQQKGEKPYDWIKYMITRYNPSDQPSIMVASYLRSILGDAVMMNEFYLSTAVADAATSAESVVEVDPSNFHRQTYQRSWDSIARITSEVEALIHTSWGRT